MSIVGPHHVRDLIDEHLIVITLVILEAGETLFDDRTHTRLRPLDAQAFRSGNILLHYAKHERETP